MLDEQSRQSAAAVAGKLADRPNYRRMRIALVHMRQSETGGTERYLNQMAKHLAELGYRVTIVCRSHEFAPHPEVKFVQLRPPVIGSTWRMWSFARAVEQHVRRAGYDLVFGLGKAWSHDVVRLGGGCHATYLELAHAQAHGGWGASGWLKQRVALKIEARALRPGAYRRVIVNSEMVKRDAIARHQIPEQRVAVVYNGVDLDRFDRRRHTQAAQVLRRQCGFSDDDIVVLFLGTGYGRKGLTRLLDAFAIASHRRPELRLLVVGYDSAQQSYKDEAKRLGIAKLVRFVGGRRDPEICYAASDLYVLPTFYDPFANSTLEALASGLPVITTVANGAAEVLTDETGALADEKTLASELLHWTERDQLVAARVAARQLAQKYSAQATAEASCAVLVAAAAEKVSCA